MKRSLRKNQSEELDEYRPTLQPSKSRFSNFNPTSTKREFEDVRKDVNPQNAQETINRLNRTDANKIIQERPKSMPLRKPLPQVVLGKEKKEDKTILYMVFALVFLALIIGGIILSTSLNRPAPNSLNISNTCGSVNCTPVSNCGVCTCNPVVNAGNSTVYCSPLVLNLNVSGNHS
jgi:hypothetical protein